jgi:cyclic pyranopterin phosphate synthase
MPAEIFGPDYPFLKDDQRMSFDEIIRLIQGSRVLGVEKVRLTGGEPLMRRNLHELVSRIRSETKVPDLALTTNGLLLKKQAQRLKESGLDRINLSLDALDQGIFHAMSGGRGSAATVIGAATYCKEIGLGVKINTVLKAGVNESQIVPLLHFGIKHGIEVRFIEYMDVGCSNGWDRHEVVSERRILEHVKNAFGTIEPVPMDPTAVSRSHQIPVENYKFGVIASITRPFCGGCVRARVSSDGKIYTCLFSQTGIDIRHTLGDGKQTDLVNTLAKIWLGRSDNYSEQRGSLEAGSKHVEMSFIGG